MIPFVTEEIWSFMPGDGGLLAARVTGDAPVGEIDEPAEEALARMIAAVQAVRSWRNSAEVAPGATLTARLQTAGYEQTATELARLARLTFMQPDPDPGAVASIPIPGGVIEILPGGDLDLGATERRRHRQRATFAADIDRSERKLANPGFIAKAPAEVVQAERAKLARLRAERDAI